jgi:hypothetical protein
VRWLRRGKHQHRSLHAVKHEGFVMHLTTVMCRVIMDYSIRFSL